MHDFLYVNIRRTGNLQCAVARGYSATPIGAQLQALETQWPLTPVGEHAVKLADQPLKAVIGR